MASVVAQIGSLTYMLKIRCFFIPGGAREPGSFRCWYGSNDVSACRRSLVICAYLLRLHTLASDTLLEILNFYEQLTTPSPALRHSR
jgi:hypothetical protein